MLWMCIWMCPHHITAAHFDQAFGIFLEFWVHPRQQMMVTHQWQTYQNMFGNLHMMWMCIWIMFPCHITAASVHQAFGICLEFWVTPRQQIMVKCSDWCCRPKPDWSHINVKHIQSVWQPSYAVDVHMDVSSPHYGCPCWPSFWNLPRILCNSKATNQCIPHLYQMYTKCLSYLICCGWAYGCVLATLQLPMLTKRLELC